ncbi:MAG: FliA/WhiG family RNA polymerase sigma factor [Armatimonadota bacterium]
MAAAEELWRRWKERGDEDARQQIILSYAYLTRFVVDRLLLRPNSVIGYDDLLGHAAIGLIDAVERFDPGVGVEFATYAVWRIRGAVLDALKNLDWVPRSVRAKEQSIKRAYAKLEARLARPASDEEVAAELGMTVDELAEALEDIGQSVVCSLEELLADGDQAFAPDRHADSSDLDPASAAEKQEKRRLLARAIDELPEREKLVLGLYYGEELTLREIAAVLGVTESRVCQIHARATIRLHGKLARHAELLLAA